jgi:hypothetical protein
MHPYFKHILENKKGIKIQEKNSLEVDNIAMS